MATSVERCARGDDDFSLFRELRGDGLCELFRRAAWREQGVPDQYFVSRSVIFPLVAASTPSEREYAKIPAMEDLHYMRLAFEDARQAYAAGNRPVAAIIVRDDAIIASGRNTVFADRDPTAHAEVEAIRVACRSLDTLDLAGATLYSTLEPCPMCLWMILEAKIARVVLGARHAALKRTDTGDYSVETFLALTRRPLEIVTGVLEKECVELRLRWMQEQGKRAVAG